MAVIIIQARSVHLKVRREGEGADFFYGFWINISYLTNLVKMTKASNFPR